MTWRMADYGQLLFELFDISPRFDFLPILPPAPTSYFLILSLRFMRISLAFSPHPIFDIIFIFLIFLLCLFTQNPTNLFRINRIIYFMHRFKSFLLQITPICIFFRIIPTQCQFIIHILDILVNSRLLKSLFQRKYCNSPSFL